MASQNPFSVVLYDQHPTYPLNVPQVANISTLLKPQLPLKRRELLSYVLSTSYCLEFVKTQSNIVKIDVKKHYSTLLLYTFYSLVSGGHCCGCCAHIALWECFLGLDYSFHWAWHIYGCYLVQASLGILNARWH